MTAVPPADAWLPHAWFIACTSAQLGTVPRAVMVQRRPLVLFRDAQRRPAAFLDRCPHRNVPLSLGRVDGGELRCAYHGWTFDSSGACTSVPGLVTQTPGLKSRCAEHYATRELDGFVWVYSSAATQPTHEPFRFPHLETKGYTTVRREFVVEAPLHAALENTLDVPHTSFLHGGLFRTADKKNVIDVVVRRTSDRAEAEFRGEPAPRGLAGRVLAPGGGIVEHVDRFLLPSIAQVEYRLGSTSHLMTTTAFTPVTEDETRVYAVVTLRLPIPGWVVRPFIAPIASRIFAQDRVMLRAQRARVRELGGERYTSTELDVLGPQMTLLLKHAAAGTIPSEPHEHQVQMKT